MDTHTIPSSGHAQPPAGTKVSIGNMAGLGYYIWWPECPHGEDVLYAHIATRQEAKRLITILKWVLI